MIVCGATASVRYASVGYADRRAGGAARGWGGRLTASEVGRRALVQPADTLSLWRNEEHVDMNDQQASFDDSAPVAFVRQGGASSRS